MRHLSTVILLSASFVHGAPALAQDAGDARARRVDSLFAQYTVANSPGLALAVVRDGKVILQRGYGLADIEHRVPITPATVFDVASVSKQFAGLAVAMLVQEGKIKLTDDIRTYLPELPVREKPITVDHLLHHTSGLRDWPGTLAVAGWRFDDVISFDQILRMAFAQRTLNFVPGAEYLYSNTGYNVLTEMVQRVTKQPFRAWTDERIFRPLRMTDTRFRDDHSAVIANRAFGYARAQDGTFRHVPNALTALGSSSMFSTVSDLARWLINFDEGTVGGGGALSMMRTRGILNDGSTIPYAFGIVAGTHRGQPMFNHSGGWASFSTYLVHMPAQRFGVVVLANSGIVNAQNAAMSIANVYLDGELATATASSSGAAAAATTDVPVAALEAYQGLYRLGPGWYTRIKRTGSTLTTQATREDAAPMTARSEREFWVEGYGASMIFHRDSSGRVTHLEYRGRRAPRVEETVGATAPPLNDYIGEYESEELATTYRVAVRDGSLELRHFRHGTIPLAWLRQEEFGSATWFLRGVEFQRDGGGRVTGLLVNGDLRSRDIRFVKRR